jgi:uncharacterized YigZ family protein
MLFDDSYQSISARADAVFRDRGSKFLAFAFPIHNEGELKEIIARLKSEHPKANHYCWAMRISPDRSVFRLNDDGEPSGTAGRPILNALLSKDITNILVVVVRYFGGTLLGVPGLINAYKSATELALAEAKVIQQTVNDIYTVTFSYLQMNEVMKVIKDEQLLILEQSFDNQCVITLSVRKMQVNKALARIENISSVIALFKYTA